MIDNFFDQEISFSFWFHFLKVLFEDVFKHTWKWRKQCNSPDWKVINILPYLLHLSFSFPLFFLVKVLVAQSCIQLWDPMDCSLPDSSVLGILRARILEWVAIPFSKGSSRPSRRSQISHLAGRFFTIWATQDLGRPVNISETRISI